MKEIKFKTVGEFLTLLEKRVVLYCNEGCRYALHSEKHMVVITNQWGNESFCSTLRGLIDIIKERKFTHTPPLYDKCLVWCWDNEWIIGRNVSFFDFAHDTTFNVKGKRNGSSYDNYEIIPKNPETGLWDAPFEWANNAVNKLED